MSNLSTHLNLLEHAEFTMNLAQIRKAIVAALGFAVTLVLVVPENMIPEAWRPWVGVILALGTVAGVYRVRNDQPDQKAADRLFGPRRSPPTG